MFEINEEELSFEFTDDPKGSQNTYIADNDKAARLISTIIGHNEKFVSHRTYEIKRKIDQLFDLYSQEALDSEVEYYSRFMQLCDRLSERHRISKIHDKTVIGVGGKFSAGKSKFINSIAGLEGLLPEDTSETTSIPTYILNDSDNYYIANNVNGSTYDIDIDMLQAMTHEFYHEYHIGFSSFVESIVIGRNNSKLHEDLVILDTPGYNKYDNKTKSTISDRRKARKQLNISDFLIWLVDVDNGVITQEDLDFVSSLNVVTPILIVFNKCDKKTAGDITEVLELAKNVIQNAGLQCYGIAAYSAFEEKEYDGCILMDSEKEYSGNIIYDFMQYAAESKLHSNDVLSMFKGTEKRFIDEIVRYTDEAYASVKGVEEAIKESDNVTNLKSLSQIWSIQNREVRNMRRKKRQSLKLMRDLKDLVSEFLEVSGE